MRDTPTSDSPAAAIETGKAWQQALAGGVMLVVAGALGAVTMLASQHTRLPHHSQTSAAIVATAPTPTRANGASAAPPTRSVLPATTQVRAGPTIYLTATQAQLQAAQVALDQAAALRQTGGLGATEAELVIVSEPADEARVRQAMADENSTRDALGLPEINVVDLRQTP